MPTNRKRSEASRPLHGVICCVDTKNEDGSDASSAYVKILTELGAVVEAGGIKTGLTHMIWARGNIKHAKAAEIMDICVVSPLWVEQCREANTRVSEEDFLVQADGSTNPPPQPPMEPKINHASFLASPTINSSQADEAPVKSRSRKPVAPKRSAPPEQASEIAATQRKRRKAILPADSSSDSDDDFFDMMSAGFKNNNKVSQPSVKGKATSTKTSAASPQPGRKPSTITISLTSFSSGDRAMLCDILSALREVRLVDDEDYSFAALTKCDALVAPKKRANRTVRVLFALACGIPIVTEDFVYHALESEACRAPDVPKFIHPRFKAQKTTTKQLSEREVYIGPCIDPPVSVVADLVQALGGSRVSSLADADIVIVEGNSGKNNGAVQRMKDFRQNLSASDLKHLDALSLSGNVITTKSLFDAIEFGGSLKLKSVSPAKAITSSKTITPFAPKSATSASPKSRTKPATTKKTAKRLTVVSDSSEDDLGSPTPPSKMPRRVVSTRLPRKNDMPSPIAPLSKSHVLDDDSEGEADLSYVINVPQQDGSPSW